jgi:hypothetical protein
MLPYKATPWRFDAALIRLGFLNNPKGIERASLLRKMVNYSRRQFYQIGQRRKRMQCNFLYSGKDFFLLNNAELVGIHKTY